MEFFTIGHSTHPLEYFVSLLTGYGIQILIDIRTVPRSMHNPQFNKDDLAVNLQSVGIRYVHLKELGGLRRPKKDSSNLGWKNNSFRGYADYMQTGEFSKALDRLIALGEKNSVAFMCAEAVPWRCHRSLVSDALTVRGFRVNHIMSRVSAPRHQVTSFAKIDGTQVTYPASKASE